MLAIYVQLRSMAAMPIIVGFSAWLAAAILPSGPRFFLPSQSRKVQRKSCRRGPGAGLGGKEGAFCAQLAFPALGGLGPADAPAMLRQNGKCGETAANGRPR
jgi:hypothetical protein